MTYKGLVLYYSATGNTKSVAEMFPRSLYDIENVRNFDVDRLNNYDIIVLGMSTWQRGMPPKIFQKLAPDILALESKTFYFFGSVRVEYEYFCGALDLYKELLEKNNKKVIDIFKYEGYPNNRSFVEAHKFIANVNDKLKEINNL